MENQNLKLEFATAADVHEISALVNSAYRGESSKQGWTTEADLLGGQRTDPETLEKSLSVPCNFVFTYRENGEMKACVNLMQKESSCYLGMLTVKPTLQKSGLGRKVLSAAEEIARRQFGSKEMYMTVITIREELISWYERCGYRRTGEFENFPYGDEKFGIPKRPDLKFEILRKRL